MVRLTELDRYILSKLAMADSNPYELKKGVEYTLQAVSKACKKLKSRRLLKSRGGLRHGANGKTYSIEPVAKELLQDPGYLKTGLEIVSTALSLEKLYGKEWPLPLVAGFVNHAILGNRPFPVVIGGELHRWLRFYFSFLLNWLQDSELLEEAKKRRTIVVSVRVPVRPKTA